MIVLGIESSCDETAAALVRSDGTILADRLLSQTDAHAPYGGVVPEIAARVHVAHMDHMIADCMQAADLDYDALDGIAATAGPGLIGGLLVGLITGKALALACRKPLLAINHLEGHALTARLTDKVSFPYLLLLVSGGHCQLLAVEAVGRYSRLGTTIDDAIGEAFDKTAKLLGLGYPGGPAVERAAATGDPARFDLPRPMQGRPGADFSFSGLKTAVRHRVDAIAGEITNQDRADLAAGFQQAAADSIMDRTANAIELFRQMHPGSTTLVVAGGVAANRYLRVRLQAVADDAGFTLIVPPPALCTDNAVMIAWAGVERLVLGLTDDLRVPARPRWPLDPAARPAGLGARKA